LKYALIASLALNLLVLGTVAGTMYGFSKYGPPRPGHMRGEDFGLMGLSREFPEERRKEFRKLLRDDRAKLKPMMEDIRVSRRAAADLLAAEPFDRSALENAIAAVAEKERAFRHAAVMAFLGHAEQLTPDERRMLADWWRKKTEPRQSKNKKKEKADAEGTEGGN
jgi:uncharacterized membrane protein